MVKNYFKIAFLIIVVCLIVFPLITFAKEKKKKVKEIEPVKVNYTADDNFKIVADLYMPLTLKKNQKVPVVVFLHSIGESKKIWIPYAKELVRKGYAVFAIDFRGHGESVVNKKNTKQYWRAFKDNNWKYLSSDVINGIKELSKNYPQANTNKLLIVGASMGGSAAIICAEKYSNQVVSIVLLSPFSNYKGIEARVALVNYGKKPVLIIVSKSDREAYKDSLELLKYTQGRQELAILQNSGHGERMLSEEPKLKKVLFDWIARYLPPTIEVFVPAQPPEKNKEE